MIKDGSRWYGSDMKIFVVIGTSVVEGKEWVYYRSEKPSENGPREFSCYKESFLARFTEMPE